MRNLIKKILKENEWDWTKDTRYSTIDLFRELFSVTHFSVSKASHQGVKYLLFYDNKRDITHTMSNLVPDQKLSNEQVDYVLDYVIRTLEGLRELNINYQKRKPGNEDDTVRRIESQEELINIISQYVEKNNINESEDDGWGWTKDVKPMTPYSELKIGDYIQVLDIIYEDWGRLMDDCGEPYDIIEVGLTYFITRIDDSIERENVICGCGAYHDNCIEKVKGIEINGFWVAEDMVQVGLVKKNLKYD